MCFKIVSLIKKGIICCFSEHKELPHDISKGKKRTYEADADKSLTKAWLQTKKRTNICRPHEAL
jgi:hypothetical protein